MRITATMLAAVAAVGCASHRAQAPPPVVQIRPEQSARCTRVGAVEGSHANGVSVAENEELAIEEIRRRVAKLGGNAFAITRRTSSMWRSVVQADAYLCPSWEPVPGLPPG